VIREIIEPRDSWQAKVEARGLRWHTVDGTPYWNESACYRFTSAEVEEIEAATATLYGLFLDAGQAIVDDPQALGVFGIPAYCHDAIRTAWNNEPPALNFGRFDLGYDGEGPPKLFEFNCDTPTSLLEAAVIQWDWKEECYPQLDQFNSLHEKLVAKWADIRTLLPGRQVIFTHVADAIGEDAVTTAYLRDTAHEAGLSTDAIPIDRIGWNGSRRMFVDADGARLATLFKLYPWEWLVNETFGQHLIDSLDRTIWIEPIWKMIWSNKAILPVLWSMFRDHPNLLYASFERPFGDHVRKPRLAREGANVEIISNGRRIAGSGGFYGADGFVFQDLYRLPQFAPNLFPVVGSWIVDGAAAGMGIREDGLITGNTATFVPHIIDG
jgi:glutathionylspermidine synthase